MKQKMRNIAVMFWLFILSATGVAAQSTTAQTQTGKEQREAERLWEQMVKVKGGRERLHAITNTLFTLGDKPKDIGVKLSVYPTKQWFWRTGPPVPDFVAVSMVNLDLDVSLGARSGGLPNADEVTEETRRNIRQEMLQEACAYLLETKWLQPKPLRITRQRVSGKLMDVLETRVRDVESGLDERMDFYIEPESLLAHRVVLFYKGKPNSYYCFADYAMTDGISMPRQAGSQVYRPELWNKPRLCGLSSLSARFNVEYDPHIFERPPSVEAGADAWRATRR